MSIVETFNASTSWTCPDGVTAVTVECYGPGGNGGPGEGSIEGYAGGGGGGGAYASALVAVTPGAIYTLSVPAGGSAQPTYFKDAFTVKADYGRTGSFGTVDYGGPGGPGGSIADCAGSTRLAGQDGATGTWNDGGAGGNAGGPAGGVGGTGNGGSGAAPGAGGGGGHWNNLPGPGSGAAGRIILTYGNSYTAQLQSFSRTPVTMLVLTMDYCGRTCGVSPCLATGEKCYNTFPTCKYRNAYLKQQKDYKFTSAAAGLPFKTGERPYLRGVKYLPTEIATTLTVSGRVTLEMLDDQNTDAAVDPYYSQRTSVASASFWKRFYARNRNYKGRPVKIYEGFMGLSETEFSQKWVGTIENLTVPADGSVKIECIDLLKGLKGVQVPPKLDIKLLNALDTAQTEIVLYTPNATQVTGLDATGYVRIGDEIILYSGFNQALNKLTGCIRGYYGTTAATHKQNDRVQKCRFYAPQNPFDILKTMLLTDADIESSSLDITAFDFWKTFPITDEKFSAMISEPTDLEKLYFEILEMLDCKSWVAEDLKITIRRNLPNEPGRGDAYVYLSDGENIVQKSMKVDANEKSRITRVICYWDPKPIGKQDDVTTYRSVDLAVDADAESANEYGDTIEKKIFCRWLQTGETAYENLAVFVRNQIARILFRYRDAEPIIEFQVELKDMDIRTGGYAIISTDAVLDRDGKPVDDPFQLVRRDKRSLNTVGYRALRLSQKRIGFIAPGGTPDYADQSDAEREYGSICDPHGLIGDIERSYHIY